MYAEQEDEETAEYYAMLKDVEILNDLPYSRDYFGGNYEPRRIEFFNCFVENRWNFEEYFR